MGDDATSAQEKSIREYIADQFLVAARLYAKQNDFNSVLVAIENAEAYAPVSPALARFSKAACKRLNYDAISSDVRDRWLRLESVGSSNIWRLVFEQPASEHVVDALVRLIRTGNREQAANAYGKCVRIGRRLEGAVALWRWRMNELPLDTEKLAEDLYIAAKEEVRAGELSQAALAEHILSILKVNLEYLGGLDRLVIKRCRKDACLPLTPLGPSDHLFIESTEISSSPALIGVAISRILCYIRWGIENRAEEEVVRLLSFNSAARGEILELAKVCRPEFAVPLLMGLSKASDTLDEDARDRLSGLQKKALKRFYTEARGGAKVDVVEELARVALRFHPDGVIRL